MTLECPHTLSLTSQFCPEQARVRSTDIPSTCISQPTGLLQMTSLPLLHMQQAPSDIRSTLERSAPASIFIFQEERANLLSFLEQQARLIRQQPVSGTIETVKNNLQEHAPQLIRRVNHAAMAMAILAKNHPYVIGKPTGFYSVEVPKMCGDLEQSLLDQARRLGLNSRCDMCVHFTIENIRVDIGF